MSYAGDLTPQEAWAKLEDGAILVDVRTEGEWAHIGIPDTTAAGTENDPLFIQWNLAGGIPNSALHRTAAAAGPRGRRRRTGLPVPFRRPLHRRRDRRDGRPASPSYNVLEGFEGEPDRHGDRTVNGWKNRGLPTNLESTK